MKLLLDEMLDPAIAAQLCARGHDVAATQRDRELQGRSDLELLRAARIHERVLVTDNVRDFARHHGHFLASGEDHAGLILAAPRAFPRSKRSIGLWVRALDAVLTSARREAEWRNVCECLEPPADPTTRTR